MISQEEIEKLAQLVRIELTEKEKTGLQKDMESILGMVDELKNAPLPSDDKEDLGLVKNVMREDENAYETGQFTADVLSVAPRRDGEFIKVKKIL